MKKIRIGKDIPIEWTILTNGVEQSLEKKDLKVEIRDRFGHFHRPAVTVSGNVISFTYRGTRQIYTGVYSLTLWQNYRKEDQNAVDISEAFRLVADTEQEDAGGCDRLASPLQYESSIAEKVTDSTQWLDEDGCPIYDANGNAITD